MQVQTGDFSEASGRILEKMSITEGQARAVPLGSSGPGCLTPRLDGGVQIQILD